LEPAPVVYGAEYSVYTRIVRLTLIEKGVDYRFETVDVFAAGGVPPAHLLRQPFGRIPAFAHGDVGLYEACAIARYVDAAFAGPALQPRNAIGQARVAQIVSILDSYAFRPLVQEIYVERVAKPDRGVATDEARLAAALAPARRCLAALDALASASGWLVGDEISLADLHAVPMFAYFVLAPDGKAMLAEHPRMAAWWQRAAALASVAATPTPAERCRRPAPGGSLLEDDG